MPRKLNKNLVGALTLGGMVVLAAIGIIMLWKLSSQDPARYEQEAKKLADAGDYDRAWQTYYRAFQKGGQNNIEDLVKAAHCAIEDGKLPQALGMLDKALVRESQLPSALNESTRLNFELGNLYPGDLAMWRRVLESAQKLVKVDDSSVLGHHALGMAYLKLQDNDTTYEALGRQHLSRALELDPANADIAQDMVEQLWDAAARKQKGGPETAEVKALRETAESTLKSAIEKCEGQGPPEAISKLKELQCRLLIIEDKTEEGLDQLKRLAAGEQKKATAHLLLAQALAGGLTPNTKPDYAKAAETAEEGLKLDPRDMKLYFMLAEAYRQKHKEEELTEADWQELEQVYQRGLDAVPFRNHFRAGADNNFRIEFMTQLFMLDLQRAAQAKDDAAERTKALDSAERWITKLKGEVDEQSLVVRFLRAELFKAK